MDMRFEPESDMGAEPMSGWYLDVMDDALHSDRIAGEWTNTNYLVHRFN